MDYEKKYKEALEWARKVMQGKVGFVLDEGLEKFPELKESEDEKIRKEIIDIIDSYDVAHLKAAGLPSRIPEYIAWLEKQGEHANFLSKIQAGDKVTRNEDGVLVNLSQLNRVAKKDEKQGEQNLVKHFCDCVHVGCHVNDCKRWCHSYQKEIFYTDCNSDCNRYSKLMNHAFNIGETITDGISTFKIADIKDNHYIADDGERVEIYMAHRYYTTIQNLEVQKSAWSEEDENLMKWSINNLTELKDRFGEEYGKVGDCINWLKSFRPQSTWKPSDEQMNTLEYYMHTLVCNEYKEILFGLYADLKKLMEE